MNTLKFLTNKFSNNFKQHTTYNSSSNSLFKYSNKFFSNTKLQMPKSNHTPKKYTGTSYEDILKMRQTYINPGCLTVYKKPLYIVEGKGQYVWDETGKQYIDWAAGIVTNSVGHSHPRIAKAAYEQLNKINHTSYLYLNEENSKFAKELSETMPEGLNSVLFMSSGTEANDMALLMARAYTGYDLGINIRGSYHGLSGTPREFSSLGIAKYNTAERQSFEKLNVPDFYRGLFPVGEKYTIDESIDEYIKDSLNVINNHCPKKVAAVFMEPIQGFGGILPLPRKWINTVVEAVRAKGGLFIADEVQTGFGRLGKTFWGFQQRSDMTPDIVIVAKGIGNGIPLSAVVTRPEIAEALKKSFHFNTYGGNAFSSRIGSEVLSIIKDEKLQENSSIVGKYFKAKLEELMKTTDFIGDVRGRGLLLGMELVKSKKTKEPFAAGVVEFMEVCKEHGVMVSKGGLVGNIIRFGPCLSVTKQDVDYSIDVFKIALEKLKSVN